MWNNVWYRSTAAVNIPAWEDRGDLIIERGAIRFSGKRKCVEGRIRSVGRTQMGINSWVHGEYDSEGQGRDAYFMDGGLLGWAGMLGGNKRLAVDLAAASA